MLLLCILSNTFILSCRNTLTTLAKLQNFLYQACRLVCPLVYSDWKLESLTPYRSWSCFDWVDKHRKLGLMSLLHRKIPFFLVCFTYKYLARFPYWLLLHWSFHINSYLNVQRYYKHLLKINPHLGASLQFWSCNPFKYWNSPKVNVPPSHCSYAWSLTLLHPRLWTLVQAVLVRTVGDYTRAGHDCQSSSLEIRLIQSQDDIRNPEITYRAEIYN